MTPRELSTRLNFVVEAVCRELLPQGKRQGPEWCVGDLHGAAGDSCRVHLSGDKTGVWSDFQTGQCGGDLLDLWCAARSVDLGRAMREAKAWLGIANTEFEPKARKTYQRPNRPKDARRPSAVADYLNKRGITDAAIAAFQIGERPDKDGKPAIVFPYKRDGDLVMIKYLSLERGEDGKKRMWGEKDCEPCLFGWQAMDPTVRAVALCEGEIDAMTLHQFGIAALSVPGGAGNHQWVEHDYDHLERFEQIFLCFDSDAAGRKGALALLDRLGRHRCRVVEMPHKDANAALMAGAGLKEFAAWFAQARTLDPDELKNAGHFTEEVIAEFYPSGEVAGLGLPWDKVADKVRFRSGELSIWTGLNGSGKSLALGFIAIHAMAGAQRVCIASMEMAPRKTLYRMVRQASGLRLPSEGYIRAVQCWFGEGLWLFDATGTAKAEKLMVDMEYASRRYAIHQFIVDSLAKCGIAEDDYAGQKALVERLSDFARRHSAHVHLVVHPRKQEDEDAPPGKMDVKGTGAITDMADNVFSVWRNKRKEKAIQDAQSEGDEPAPDTLSKPDVTLTCSKQRNGEWEGGIALWFDRESWQYLGSSGEPRRRYVEFSEKSNAI